MTNKRVEKIEIKTATNWRSIEPKLMAALHRQGCKLRHDLGAGGMVLVVEVRDARGELIERRQILNVERLARDLAAEDV